MMRTRKPMGKCRGRGRCLVAQVIRTSIPAPRNPARTTRLFSPRVSANLRLMWKWLLAGGGLGVPAFAQNSPQFELANLREDIRGLTQRVGEIGLRLEQVE